jgi:hypothetical protein
MHSVTRVTVAAMVLGIGSLALTGSAHAGNGLPLVPGSSDLVSEPLWATRSHRKRCMSLRRRPSITLRLLLSMSRQRRFMWAQRTTSGIPIEAIAANAKTLLTLAV